MLDLGLAIAGPFGTQLLSDLGATVIKVNGLFDLFWHRVHIAYMANRGKKSITLNLKDPRAMKILLELVAKADVVQHNMRYDAAERLKIDYESLKKIKPKLIYCHSRGFESGERAGPAGQRPDRRLPVGHPVRGRRHGAAAASRCGASPPSATPATASCRRSP